MSGASDLVPVADSAGICASDLVLVPDPAGMSASDLVLVPDTAGIPTSDLVLVPASPPESEGGFFLLHLVEIRIRGRK